MIKNQDQHNSEESEEEEVSIDVALQQIESNFNERYEATQRNPATTRIQRNPATTGIQRNPEHRRRHFRNCIKFLASDPATAELIRIIVKLNRGQFTRMAPEPAAPLQASQQRWVFHLEELNVHQAAACGIDQLVSKPRLLH
ncbi:hypothetical protein AVEN_27995-1 [Araneus ventricosus]|uniref:Uncharacterized protein n=1 Tax=Araneus ventricosus TaxID=182803 RepID=A0A4Y2BFR4_ARAVE|nr:hypothetical protein AVEN_27995-1 [Araneus ventricosus]